jgi:hypothetical protein
MVELCAWKLQDWLLLPEQGCMSSWAGEAPTTVAHRRPSELRRALPCRKTREAGEEEEQGSRESAEPWPRALQEEARPSSSRSWQGEGMA